MTRPPAASPSPLPAAPVPALLAWLFFPLCPLLGLLARGRAALFGWGWRRTRRLPFPVVSVGNLTVGGTGKTPVVELLARLAAQRGLQPVVLSRGHGRRGGSTALRLRLEGLAPGEGPDAAAVGDEPLMLARRNPTLSIYLGRARYQAGLLAQAWESPPLALLDDGYQHLPLGRNLNLLLLDEARGWGNGRMAPCGWLREPLSALKRADAVLITKSGTAPQSPWEAPLRKRGFGGPIFRLGYRPAALARLDGQERHQPSWAGGRRAAMVCGLAQPEAFAQTISQMGARLEEKLALADHDPYGPSTLARLQAAMERQNGLPWLTTEKDAVKLAGRVSHPDRVWVVEMEVVSPPEFDRFFLDTLGRLVS